MKGASTGYKSTNTAVFLPARLSYCQWRYDGC